MEMKGLISIILAEYPDPPIPHTDELVSIAVRTVHGIIVIWTIVISAGPVGW